MKLRLTFREWSRLVDCGQIADARDWMERVAGTLKRPEHD